MIFSYAPWVQRMSPSPSEKFSALAARASQQRRFVTSLHKLYAKLCRELAQSEHSAVVHTRREARRLGDVAPAKALLSLGQHAEMLRPRFTALLSKRQPAGMFAGRTVGHVFSTLRHFLFDRLIDTERSYRGTLLGFHHGIACARLLREVADRVGDDHMVSFCDDMLADRVPLLEAAEQQVAYFARRPQKAIKSGLSVAFEPLTEQ
jgi:hypothetical protein